MNKSSKLLAIVLLVLLIGVFFEETIESSKLNNYGSLGEMFEIISELFSVFVALSIFSLTWHSYNKSRDNKSLFLGTIFLITGLLILCHLLSYLFMPDFITPNSDNKAAIFFLESRFILAFLLLVSVYVRKDSFPKLINKYVMVSFAIAVLSLSMAFALLYQDFPFWKVNFDVYSPVTVFLLLLITIINLVTGHLYNKMAKETLQANLYYLANGSIIILVSNLIYFSYEFSGHFLIITGFVYFYLGLYKSSIELPYEKLSISEEKLRLSAQEKYRRLFDNANDAVVTIDTDGRVTSWNKSAQKLFGWTQEEITGKRFIEAIATPETVNEKEKIICELPLDTVTVKETSCIRRDGIKIDISVTISPMMDAKLNVVERSLIIRDITGKKKSEEALRNSEKFSKTILNSMNDGIMVIDAYDFTIVSVNASLLEKYGLKVEEAIGKKCFEVSHNITEPCYRRGELCPLINSLETGKYSTYEHIHFGKNGQKRYVQVSTSPIKDEFGKIVQIIHVTRDITDSKLAENALHESEEKFEKAFRSSPQIFTITSFDDGRFIEVNNSFTRGFGYSREEAIGHTPLELGIWITHQDKIRFDFALQENGFVHNVELDLKTKNGDTLTMLISAELMDVAKKACVLSTFYDITQKKRAEEALRENEEKYRILVDNANEAIFVLQDGWIKFANRRATEITGYSQRELMIMPFQVFIHKDDLSGVIENYNKRMKGETVPIKYSFRIVTINGIVRWTEIGVTLIEWKGKPATLNFLTDITQRKLIEDALHASEEKFEKAFRSSPQALILTGLNDGRFMEVNNSFTNTFGYSREEAVGHTTLEFGIWITQDDRNRFVNALQKNGYVHNAQLDMRTKKGDTVSMLASAELIDVAGKACMLSTFDDITELKQAEEKIKKSLDEKEVLLREIHHRVKNNMQVISSLLMLQSQNIEDKKYKNMFIESQTRIHSMALIHEKLYQSENIAQINFKEYIEGIVSNIFESYCIKRNIKIDINIENIPLNIDYAVPCGLIINELVTNSLKYAFPGERQGKIQISLKSKDNNMIQLLISDDGIGISKDMDIQNTKSLGLHLVTALAEGQLQGKIIINRERGTEFQIDFRGVK